MPKKPAQLKLPPLPNLPSLGVFLVLLAAAWPLVLVAFLLFDISVDTERKS